MKNTNLIIGLSILGLVVASGVGYYFWNKKKTAGATTQKEDEKVLTGAMTGKPPVSTGLIKTGFIAKPRINPANITASTVTNTSVPSKSFKGDMLEING